MLLVWLFVFVCMFDLVRVRLFVCLCVIVSACVFGCILVYLRVCMFIGCLLARLLAWLRVR